MTREIAVHTSRKGDTIPITEPGTIVVYRKTMGLWGVERQLSFQLVQDKGLREMRAQMADVLNFLGNCRIFAAGTVSGVPYYELERGGISVWEIDGRPVEFLEQLLAADEAEQEEKQRPVAQPVIPIPEALGEGRYRISIKEIQEADTGITTKQVLIPFLRRGGFYQLEIVCNHLPPWLEAEAMTGSLRYESVTLGPGEKQVTVYRPVCEN